MGDQSKGTRREKQGQELFHKVKHQFRCGSQTTKIDQEKGKQEQEKREREFGITVLWEGAASIPRVNAT